MEPSQVNRRLSSSALLSEQYLKIVSTRSGSDALRRNGGIMIIKTQSNVILTGERKKCDLSGPAVKQGGSAQRSNWPCPLGNGHWRKATRGLRQLAPSVKIQSRIRPCGHQSKLLQTYGVSRESNSTGSVEECARAEEEGTR